MILYDVSPRGHPRAGPAGGQAEAQASPAGPSMLYRTACTVLCYELSAIRYTEGC